MNRKPRAGGETAHCSGSVRGARSGCARRPGPATHGRCSPPPTAGRRIGGSGSANRRQWKEGDEWIDECPAPAGRVIGYLGDSGQTRRYLGLGTVPRIAGVPYRCSHHPKGQS